MAFETTHSAKFILLLLAAGACPAADDVSFGSDARSAYFLTYDKSPWTDDFSIFHMAVADPAGMVESSFSTSDDPRLKPLTRLDSSLSFSVPFLPAHVRAGDTVSSTNFWDEPVRIGGVQFGTLPASAPAVVAPPSFLIPEIALTPGAAIVASDRILDRLHTSVQVQQQSLVSQGQGDYSFETGRVRDDFEIRSNDYGSWLTSATYRYGVGTGTTVDGQFAQVAGQQSIVGLGVLEGLGPLGLVSAHLASSRDVDSSGWLARMGYDFTRDNVYVALRSHIQSSGFQAVGDVSTAEPMRQRFLASAGLDMGGLGRVSLASATQTFIDDTRRDVLALSHAVPLGGGGVLSTAAAYSPGQAANSALMFSVTYPFGGAGSSFHPLRTVSDSALDKAIVDAFGQYRPMIPRPTL